MALSRHHSALTRPRSVQEIAAEAEKFEFSTTRPLQQWLRAAKMLITESAICEQDGDIQMAYLYLCRHAELVLSKLPQHPDYRDPTYRSDMAQARKTVQKSFVKMEQWKPRLDQERQRYLKAMERRDASLRGIRQERIASQTASEEKPLEPLDVSQDARLAVLLARREIDRRDAGKLRTTQAGMVSKPASTQRHDTVMSQRDEQMDDMVRIGKELSRLEVRSGSQPSRSSYRAEISFVNSSYPSIHPPHTAGTDFRFEPSAPQIQNLQPASASIPPPPIPAKGGWNDTPIDLPGRPPKTALATIPAPKLPDKYAFTATAKTESGNPLRPMLLPPGLADTFTALAAPNTARNLETCGILGCTPHAGALFVTHLILPAQTATSDTCDTTAAGDEALFAYCDAAGLLVAGWIHTHPTQTCFLSSRDLHTSSGYQIMLPEAIAIVCAPSREPRCGVFRLTDPPGLGHVLDCTRPGNFHPHDIDHLYTDAEGGTGHVVEGPGLDFEVVDLRDD